MAERATTRNLSERVAKLSNDALKLARDGGRPDLATQLTDEAKRWPAPEVTVLVAGETSRGKSSLVNALVGRPTLLPTGPGIVSRTFVAVRRGAQDAVSVVRKSGTEPHPATLDELADWASDTTGDVVGIEVSLADTALPAGVTIIDTPGVGGLEDAHARVTLTALGRADALLMVCDPSAPLSAPELSFLANASTRVATVMVTMTKVDQFGGWRSLIDADRALLDREGHGDVEIVPVSGRLGLLSLKSDNPALAAELWDDSGLTPVRQLINHRLAGRSQALRMANLTRLASSVAAALDQPLQMQLEMYADDAGAEVVAALEAERQRLDDLRDSAPRYQTWLTDRFASMREQLLVDATAAIRDMVERYDRNLATYRKDLEGLVEAVRAELEVIEADAFENFATAVRETCYQLATMIGSTDGADIVSGRLIGRADLGSIRAGTSARSTDAMASIRSISTVSGLVSSLTFLLRTSGMAGPGLVPIMFGAFAMTAGAGLTSLIVSARNKNVDRMRVQLRSLHEAARAELGPALRERALVLQRGMEDELRTLIRERTRDYQNRVTEAQNAQRVDAAQRQKTRAELRQRLSDLQAVRREAGELAALLSASLQPRADAVLAATPDQPSASPAYVRQQD